MEPHRWWYPFLGKLKYRGYFNKAEADQYAQTFTSNGYDVAVEGVVAYSTLGWFRDPVFDTFMGWSDRAIAELLFHELSHQKVFLSGKTEWNEAFAVVTARAAVREWLKSKSRFDELERYEAEIALEEAFIQLVLETKQELEQLYASFENDASSHPKSKPINLERTEKTQLKQSIFESFRKRYHIAKMNHPSLSVYEGWMSRPLNNARLTSIDTYYQWVPMFETLQKQYAGDWDGFFEAVKRLDKNPPSQRCVIKEACLSHEPSDPLFTRPLIRSRRVAWTLLNSTLECYSRMFWRLMNGS
jgi:predicted aminopeptidase